jgi:glycosyltransferase involved in cell wall biosynthesis
MEWSIIVFCYNEGSSIHHVVSDIIGVLDKISTAYEVIIVNDGSSDNTQEVCEQLAIKHPSLRLVAHEQNLGIGSALQTGYKLATRQYICAVPGDGQFDINLLRQVPAFDEDLFYAFYRRKTNYNLYRSLLTWGNKTFNQIFLGIQLKDVNWVKVYTRAQLSLASVKLTSSLIETEICAKLIYLNSKPVELPSDYLDRTGGKPKGGNLKTLIQALRETIKLIVEVGRFKKAQQVMQ